MGTIVSNTLSLRQNYSSQNNYITRASRTETDSSRLSKADAAALRKGIRGLANYDYKSSNKAKLSEKLKAFTDTYNYLKESSAQTGKTNAFVKGAFKKISSLTEEYEEELEKYGITRDTRGYLSMSSTATENISNEKFEKLFGKDSKFMQEISNYSKTIYNRIDIQL